MEVIPFRGPLYRQSHEYLHRDDHHHDHNHHLHLHDCPVGRAATYLGKGWARARAFPSGSRALRFWQREGAPPFYNPNGLVCATDSWLLQIIHGLGIEMFDRLMQKLQPSNMSFYAVPIAGISPKLSGSRYESSARQGDVLQVGSLFVTSPAPLRTYRRTTYC